MFEFLLINSRDKKYKNNQFNFPFFDKEMHYKRTIQFGDFFLYTLSYFNEKDFATDDKRFIAIYGSIYYPLDSMKKGNISALDISKNISIIENPLKNFRGNYAIIYYNKQTSTFKIINDPLGLKPIYYGSINGNIYVSSSLFLLKQFTNKINKTGLLETLVFDYNISHYTIFDNIFYLENGSILTVKNDRLEKSKYFSIFDFAFKEENKQFSLDEFVDLVNKVFYNRNSSKNKILISLTGGNDGRAVLSSAHQNGFKYDTFSFGMQNGENTLIPEGIAKQLKFKHISIYLDESFEEQYFQNAIDTVNLSDGNLSFEQQPTLYSFNTLQMNNYGNKVYTGLLAGEILGPIHLKHDYFNNNYYELIYQKVNFDISYILRNQNITDLVDSQFIKENFESIIPTIEARRKFIDVIKSSSKPHLYYYLDLIELGFRRFYGSQMHLIRYQAENIPVFYDIDILSFILNTNFHLRFKNSFKNLIFRWKNRIPQAYITFTNYEKLAKMPLDRGFSPADLLHPYKRYFIFLPYYKRKFIVKKKHPDFNSSVWSRNFLNQKLLKYLNSSPCINLLMLENYLESINIDKSNYSNEKNRIISKILFSRI